jgi:hypothetical protein
MSLPKRSLPVECGVEGDLISDLIKQEKQVGQRWHVGWVELAKPSATPDGFRHEAGQERQWDWINALCPSRPRFARAPQDEGLL